MAAILITQQLTQLAVAWISTAQSEFIQDEIRGLVHDRAYAADLGFYESPDYHDRLHRASTDASRRPLVLLESGGRLLQDGVTLVGMAALVLPYGAWLPAVLVLSTLPALYVVIRFNRKLHRWWEEATAERRWAAYHDWVLTYSEFAAEIRLFDLGGHFKDTYQKVRGKLRGERLQLLRDESLARLGAAMVALLVTGAVMAWMVWRAFLGQVTLGDLVLFYQAFDRGQHLMRSLLGNVGKIYTNTLFLENLFEFLDLEPQVVDPPSPEPAPRAVRDGLVFEDVTFRYPGTERVALEGFNLSVSAGQVVAIVGANGAGKSTVIKLLCRFHDPEAGRVLLDGVDIRQFRVLEFRRLTTALFQSPVPYHATVADNIGFGDLAAHPGRHAIEAAGEGAGVDGIAGALPRGYDTLLGKWFAKGTQLSVGEWQRIALARAFLRRADILVLDEPTSFMDSWTEAEWLERFRRLAAGRTTIIVTHRFTMALRADVVHVMERGRIIESGSPDELIARGGRFAQSWATQMQS
jgi:ATP-binding cassette subfamily B protein